MSKVIHFTPVEFKCACGHTMNIAVTDPEEDTDHQGFYIGDEVECFACEAKYRIQAAQEELLRHTEPPEEVNVLEPRTLDALEPEKVPTRFCSKCFKQLPAFSREGSEQICKRCKNKTYRDRARRHRR